LLETYDQTVGHGSQLMLGVAPDSRGLLPDSDAARLREFGEAIRARYSHNLALQHSGGASEAAAALDGDPDTFWSAPQGSHHATLEVDFGKPVTFNRALTMEWLNDGQHVQKYAIEIWDGKAWKQVAAAEAIGHKKIDAFATVTASRVRLNIESSSSEAHIREFQLYLAK
jgi:alpha-L-fucosidase